LVTSLSRRGRRIYPMRAEGRNVGLGVNAAQARVPVPRVKTRGREGLVALDCVAAEGFGRNSSLEAPVTTLVEVLAGGCASGFFSSDSSGK
jgi:hypothetical protein